MSNIFFTGDTHFGHKNVIKYCERPFGGVTEMNERLISNWNAVVKKDDHVYHLGDFALCKKPEIEEILHKLNGNIHLCFGNHDKKNRNFYKSKVFETFDYKEIKVPDEEMDVDQMIVLFHYPISIWNKAHHGSWHLHGHSHGTFPAKDSAAYMDVGVDCHDYMPISYDQVKFHMTRKVFKPADHHGTKK